MNYPNTNTNTDTNTNTTTLISLTLLKNQIDNGKDYYDYLVKFIEQRFIEEPNEAFGTEEIQSFVETDFGLKIPQEVIKLVLVRMNKNGALKEQDKKFSRSMTFNGHDLTSNKNQAKSDIDFVLEKLIKHAESLGHNDFDKSRATIAIQRFLSDFAIECIKSYVRGTALPYLNGGKDWEKILVALFVVKAIKTDQSLFEKFMVLVQGNMLANALICTDTSTPPSTFRKTTFYFDTPNILHALGYSGEENKNLADETIKLLLRLNGRIAVFTHNIEEAESVIDATANNIDDLRYAQKPLNIIARKEGWKKSDLILRKKSLKTDVEKLGFKIKQTPTQMDSHHINENELRRLLDENLKYDFERQKLKEYDVLSIKSIIFLQKINSKNNIIPRRLEDCNAIMVTNNFALAKAAYEFSEHPNGEYGHTSVIENFTLTNIAWLKEPDYANNLIDAQAIAHAYAAMRVSKTKLEEVLETAEQLEREKKINPDDVNTLRVSTKITQELSIARASGADLKAPETIKSVIKRIKTNENELQLKLSQAEQQNEKIQLEIKLNREENQTIKANKIMMCKIFSNVLAFVFVLIAVSAVIFGFIYQFTNPKDMLYIFTFVGDFLVAIYFSLSVFGKVKPITFGPLEQRLYNFCMHTKSKRP